MHYFAYFDPTTPSELGSIALALFALSVAGLGGFVASRLFRGFMRFAPLLIGFVVGYYMLSCTVAAFNGLSHILDEKEGELDPISPTLSFLIALLGAGGGALFGRSYGFVFSVLLQTLVAAYLIVRGTTFWYNAGYPSELALLNSSSVQMNGIFHIPVAFYIYVIIIGVLWFLGFRRSVKKVYDEDIK